MAQEFVDRVDILHPRPRQMHQKRVTVSLDATRGTVTIGGDGIDGRLIVRNRNGEEVVNFNSLDDAGRDPLGAGPYGARDPGHHSPHGRLVLSKENGEITVVVDGGAGRIGIGAPQPEAELHIEGIRDQRVDIASIGNGARSYLRLTAVSSNSRTESQIQFRDRLTFVSPLGAEGGNPLVTLFGDGRLGVGTEQPVSQLHVAGSGDQAIDISSVDVQPNSHMRLAAVTSNGRREAQVQFRGELHFVAPLGPEGGQSVMSVHESGDVFVGAANRSAGVHIDGRAGDVKLLGGDCAELLEVAGERSDIQPGTVLVIRDQQTLAPCNDCYDTRVAGVVSGAGDTRPGVVLGWKGSVDDKRYPLALAGKVHCKADASQASISPGDLLTTSAIRGHAMRATDSVRAIGSCLGKSLGYLERGKAGVIPILVALQ